MIPISRNVRRDTVKECFRYVDKGPNQDTEAWDEVWLSSYCPIVSITAPGGRQRADFEDLGGLVVPILGIGAMKPA